MTHVMTHDTHTHTASLGAPRHRHRPGRRGGHPAPRAARRRPARDSCDTAETRETAVCLDPHASDTAHTHTRHTHKHTDRGLRSDSSEHTDSASRLIHTVCREKRQPTRDTSQSTEYSLSQPRGIHSHASRPQAQPTQHTHTHAGPGAGGARSDGDIHHASRGGK